MLYQNSWQLYKKQTESFEDDIDYYYNFCKQKKSLELFAGYGRIANKISKKGIDLETVEIEKNFSQYIELPLKKNHTYNVLSMNLPYKFERIFAAYNSFCLLSQNEELKKFFSILADHLAVGGRISLNYFNTDYWPDAPSGSFILDDYEVEYYPHYDLSRKDEGYAVWTDEYILKCGKRHDKKVFSYPVRVFNTASSLKPYYEHTSLFLVEEVQNFGLEKDKISEPGWTDYIFEKRE